MTEQETARPGLVSRAWSGVRAGIRSSVGTSRGLTVVVVLLALLAAAGLAGSGAFGWHLYEQHRTDNSRAAAVHAAKSTVTSLMSVSAKTVDADIKRTLNGATGNFAKEYKSGSSKVKSAVVKNKVKAKARVLRVGVTSLSSKSATVLLSMDATVHNVNAPDGRKSHYRVSASLSRKGGTWLVSKIKFVG